MDWGYFFTIVTTFTVLSLFIQRMAEGRKRGFRWFTIFIFLLLLVRGNLFAENVLGFLTGNLVGFLFWLLIGRYNPVGNDEEIKVYGLDD